MLSRNRVLSVILLLLAGAALSLLLLLEHRGAPAATAAVDAVCGQGPASGCDAVDRSPYSELAGVPLSACGLAFCLGLAFLLTLGLVAAPPAHEAAAFVSFVGLAVAVVLDVVLFGLQAFVIRAFCRLCLSTYVINLAAFILLLPARTFARHLRPAIASREGQLVATGWVLGSIGLVAAVAATDFALAQKSRVGWTAILGPTLSAGAAAPAAAPTTTPTPSPVPPVESAAVATAPSARSSAAAGDAKCAEQLRQAQDQTRLLQQTLDEPEKLQRYLTEKSVREFDASPVLSFDTTKTPINGPAKAPIRVVTFSDFQCPWCRNLAGALAGYIPQAGGRVAVLFKHYPLENVCNPNVKNAGHVGSCLLAIGGVCAAEQGRFWQFHDRVFGSSLKAVNPEAVVKLASESGVEPRGFEACLSSPQAKERVASEVEEGRKAGVNATPTVYINGRRLPNINIFLLAIDQETKRLGLPPLPQPTARPQQ